MRPRRLKGKRNDGYVATTMDGTPIPGGVHVFSNNRKVRQQVKDLIKKDDEYAKEMSGDVIIYNINDK
jgi:hypothetical protein